MSDRVTSEWVLRDHGDHERRGKKKKEKKRPKSNVRDTESGGHNRFRVGALTRTRWGSLVLLPAPTVGRSRAVNVVRSHLCARGGGCSHKVGARDGSGERDGGEEEGNERAESVHGCDVFLIRGFWSLGGFFFFFWVGVRKM